jgi:hypothetical protein
MLSDGRRRAVSEPPSPAVIGDFILAIVSPLSGTTSKSGLFVSFDLI